MPVNEPLPLSEVVSPPLVETPNPNDALERNPGDPTISLNADGTPANAPAILAATVPVNAEPAPQSDPAHVPSPYQPEDPTLVENARLREEALQAENRFRVDRTPNVDPGLVATPPEPVQAAP
jgi:hypothetical protein